MSKNKLTDYWICSKVKECNNAGDDEICKHSVPHKFNEHDENCQDGTCDSGNPKNDYELVVCRRLKITEVAIYKCTK